LLEIVPLKLARPKRHLPKALVKVLELAVDLCRRSQLVPMRKTSRAPRLFH
jgi:hypothetical protein